jgi:heterotetrameric sarcosine oxidase gamma subunit
LRRSPIHEQLARAGAVFGESAGWERPMWFAPQGVKAEYQYGYNETTWFEHWKNEHEAVRDDVGLVDLSPFCKILVEGRDAETVLQRICTNNVAVAPGRVVYTQWLNQRAGIEADVTVARLAKTSYLVMTSAATGLAEQAWLRKNTPADARVGITDISSAQAAFGISGPRAREFLAAYTDSDMSSAAFPFGTSQQISIGPVDLRAQRISYTGECGWEVFVDAAFAPYLFELLMSGEKATAPKLIGFHAAESLRTEKAYRHWGHDIGYVDTPFESGLMFASKMEKPGGFIGCEALQARLVAGSERQLLQFLLESRGRFIYHNEPIYLDNQLVGAITTGTYGHTLGAPVGLGWVSMPEGGSQTSLSDRQFEILVAGRKVPARASLKPMYDPLNEKLRH